MRKTQVFAVVSLLLAVSAAAQQYDSQAERELVRLLNQERARAGLPSLKVDDRLTEAARVHSAMMAQEDKLSHRLPGEPALPNRLAAMNLRFDNDAENIAYDSAVEGAHIGLMHSPPHRANILSPQYNAVGVGVVRSGDVYWVTQDFAHRLQEYSANEAENAMVAAWQHERERAHQRPAPVLRMPQLRRMACAMARRGRLDTRSPLGLPNVQSAAAYTTADPAQLPSSVVQKARDGSVSRMSVGACFADGPKYPPGVWWVEMVFY
jgi:Cysteine-rich secretory protein family